MAQAASSPRTATPWSERLFEAAPVSPLWLGAGIALLVGAAFLAIEFVFGDLDLVLRGVAPREKVEEYRFTVVFALLLGYLPAAYTYAIGGSRRAWDALRPVLRCSPSEFAALHDAAGRFDAGKRRKASLMGAAFAVTIPFFVDVRLDAYNFRHVEAASVVHRLLLPISGWLFGSLIHAILTDSARLARAGRELVEVDLLDLTPLAPFTRYGLRNALLGMGAFAIFALLAVDWEARPGLPLIIVAGFVLGTGLAAAGLLLPVRGTHDAIRRAKRAELESANEAIRQRRGAMANGVGEASGGPGLDELIAWRGLVESVREWPFDASTFTRFLLYMAIPLGSWLGGAMVERFVDSVLG